MRHKPPGGRANADSLALDQSEHPVGLIRVDDLRAAVAHLAPDLEFFGNDLDATHVAAGVEDLARVDDRVGHRDQIGHVTTLRCRDSQHGEQQPAGGVAHVAADRDGVVLGPEVHRCVAAADVAVAQQAAPSPAQLVSVGLG
jgi:hypothetical protein